MITRNTYLEKIWKYVEVPVVKVLTGLRRVGKSTIMEQFREKLISNGVQEKMIYHVNMELLDYSHIKNCQDLNQDIRKYFSRSKGRRYILIDEIQEVTEWEKTINSLLAEKNSDILITGSNSHLLSSELSTLLTGRFVEIHVLPPGFSEFIEFRGQSSLTSEKPLKSAHLSTTDFQDLFSLYLKYGGMPGIHAMPLSGETTDQYLEGIASSILLKDVVKRYNIRDVSLLESIAAFISDTQGSPVSTKSIVGYLKSKAVSLGQDTLTNYLSHLCSAFLFYRVPRFDLRGKRNLEYVNKFYPADSGLSRALRPGSSPGISGLAESVVYFELRRRGWKVTVGVDRDREIDFVAEKPPAGDKSDLRHYYQVAYLIPDEKTADREFGNLEKIHDSYPKTVLSLDQYPVPGRKGIAWKNLLKWLISEQDSEEIP